MFTKPAWFSNRHRVCLYFFSNDTALNNMMFEIGGRVLYCCSLVLTLHHPEPWPSAVSMTWCVHGLLCPGPDVSIARRVHNSMCPWPDVSTCTVPETLHAYVYALWCMCVYLCVSCHCSLLMVVVFLLLLSLEDFQTISLLPKYFIFPYVGVQTRSVLLCHNWRLIQ